MKLDVNGDLLFQPPLLQQIDAKLDIGFQLGEVLFRGARAGHFGDNGLRPQPRLGQMLERDLAQMQHVAHGIGDQPRVDFPHEGAALGAGLHLDEARDFQRAQGFADGVAAGLELTRQLALGRQLVARTQLAAPHLVAELVDDLFEDAAGADRGEAHGDLLIPIPPFAS